MTETDSATEHLRVIRDLMERATVYRMISAPTAVIGGAATLIAGLAAHRLQPAGAWFLLPWLLVLLITLTGNGIFMFRDARLRNAPVFSPAFKHGFLAIIPALASGLIIGCFSLQWSYFYPGAFWSLFYGLALLATRSYAPKSMQRLAGLFFFTGLLALMAGQREELNSISAGTTFMALAFGLFHLVYGLWVGRKTRFRLSGSES